MACPGCWLAAAALHTTSLAWHAAAALGVLDRQRVFAVSTTRKTAFVHALYHRRALGLGNDEIILFCPDSENSTDWTTAHSFHASATLPSHRLILPSHHVGSDKGKQPALSPD
jgi:hypothetical protein